MRKHQEIILENIEIEAVAAEGKALAHVDGAVVFVQFAVPGDVVDIKVTKKKKNYMEGFILRMVKPSEHRLEPFCDHFGVCGGCKWQPLPYPMQLQARQQQVYDQLVRIGHLNVPEISPILGSEKTEFYRNKLEFTFSNRRWIFDGEDPEALSEKERYGLGFHVGRFFDKVLDVKKCYLQAFPSNEIRLFIKEYA
ncbi:MAG: TRAM domain-containing protein, partial [Bacteroidales bacterium]|nr:TRAM domain-containing protein [Bacteroidales bacterium]